MPLPAAASDGPRLAPDPGSPRAGPTPMLGRASPPWLALPAPAPLAARWFWLAVALLVVAAAVLRMAWLLDGPLDPSRTLASGTPILTSIDGYYYGVGAQSLLDGTDYARLRVPGAHDHLLVVLTWAATKLSPASLEQVMVYLPMVLGALLTIPVALVARELLGARVGLFATALAMASPGIVMRTSAGFLDTDPFALAVPLVALLFLVRLVDRRDPRQALWAALTLALNRFCYDQGEPIGAGLAVLAIGYLLVFHRRDPAFERELGPAIAVLGLALIEEPWFIRAPLVVLTWVVLRRLPIPPRRMLALGVGLALVGLALSLAWRSVLHKLSVYTPGGGAGTGGAALADPLAFGNSSAYVAESVRDSLPQLGSRLTGTLVTSAIGALGLLLLAWGRRSLLLALPIIAVGAFTFIGGARFAMHLGIPIALGVAAVIAWLAQQAARRGASRPIVGALSAVFAAAALMPAAATAWGARPRSALVRPEIALFQSLASHVQPGDTVVGWWDQGYPLSFYTHGRTLVDGGRRAHDASLVAEILMSESQLGAANLARTMAEWAHRLADIDAEASESMFLEAQRHGIGAPDLLRSFATPAYEAPAKTHELYLYLPLRLFDDLPTLAALRPRPPTSHARSARFETSSGTRTEGERLILPDGRIVDARPMAVVTPGGAPRPLKGIIAVHGSLAAPKVVRAMRRPLAATTGLYLDDAGVFAELDDQLLASTFVQLLLLREIDPSCFELILANDAGAIFRVQK